MIVILGGAEVEDNRQKDTRFLFASVREMIENLKWIQPIMNVIVIVVDRSIVPSLMSCSCSSLH